MSDAIKPAAPRCCWTKYERGWPSQCAMRSKVERNGKHYCGRHDPVAIEKKRQAQNEKWEAENVAHKEAYKKVASERAEMERRANAYPRLVELIREYADEYGHGAFKNLLHDLGEPE